MIKFDKGTWGLKLLSLLLAVVLWVYVTNELNPTKQQDFKGVPIETRGVRTNLAVSELAGGVNITVQANQNVLAELNAKSIGAYVDLSKVKPGKVTVPVHVKVPTGVKVTDYRPDTVTVFIEPLAEKQVPVEIKASNMPAKGYRILTFNAKPDEVVIRGPKSIIDKVKTAALNVELKDKTKSFSETLPVIINDNNGNFLDESLVKRTPALVDIFVSIVPDMPSKTVKVVPNIKGKPAQGYSVKTVVIDPPELLITGDEKLIGGINQVNTQPVDISGKQKDVYVDVGPVLPAGVMTNRQSLKLLVKIGQ